MKMIRELLDGANALGACRKTEGVDTLDKLVALYQSPQGMEFCARHHYPTALQWERIRAHWGEEELRRRNIYVDDPQCVCNPGTAVAVGAGTRLHATFSGADQVQRIIAVMGAAVTVHAERHAVFEITGDGTAEISVIRDNTTLQL